MTNEQKALEYYRAGVKNRRPKFVPCKVNLLFRVRPDLGGFLNCEDRRDFYAGPGEMACHSNQWGAISVQAMNGKMLGVKPEEFEVIEWRENKSSDEVQS